MHRHDKRLGARLRSARLRHQACPEDIDYRAPRGLDRRLMQELLKGDWITAHENLAITGPTGAGKSWLACALGHKACRDNHAVLYVRVPKLFDELALAHGDGSAGRRLKALGAVKLLILDDWALSPLADQARHDLLEILEDRYGRRSTLITSQLPCRTGIRSSARPPTPTPSWIASSTTPTGSSSAATPCDAPAAHQPLDERD